jgi:hypothetical protein
MRFRTTPIARRTFLQFTGATALALPAAVRTHADSPQWSGMRLSY